MKEGPAVALEFLHDKALTTKETGADLFVESDADAHAFGGTEEGILLGEQFAAEGREMHRHDFTGIRRTEGTATLLDALIEEHGHEERLAGEQAFARAHQRSDEAIVFLRAVAKDGLHGDVVFHIHHPAGLGHDRLPGVEFNNDELHVVAFNAVIDFVHGIHSGGA